MKSFLIGFMSAALLAGCATTNGASNGAGDDLYYLGFTPQTGGRFVHGGTGLVCPPTLLNMEYDEKKEFGDKHKDAGCVYRDGDDLATIYLSELDYSFEDIFQSSVASIGQGSFGKDIVYDQETSQTCILGGLLTSAALSLDETERRRGDEYPLDVAVFENTEFVTLVQMTELDGKFLKLRYTVFGLDEGENLEACLAGASALREVYDLSAARLDG